MKIRFLTILAFTAGLSYNAAAQDAVENFITTSLPFVGQIVPADVDDDGFTDVIAYAATSSTSDYKLVWYKNNADGSGTFSSELPIYQDTATGVRGLRTADVNGDGFLDILGLDYPNNQMVWFPSTDGNGNFGSKQIIPTDLPDKIAVVPADIDGDGDVDLVSASSTQNRISWFENTDGLGNYGSQITITTHVDFPRYLAVADMNGDNALDVISVSIDDRKIAWFENTDGLGTFSTPKLVETSERFEIMKTADIDNDGDQDIIASQGAGNSSRIVWYENEDGLGNFSSITTIHWNNSTQDFDFLDMDEDGDLDIVYCDRLNSIGYLRNLDGEGTFGLFEGIDTFINLPLASIATDINGNGKLDILSGARRESGSIFWYGAADVLSVNSEFQNQLSISPIPSSDVVNIQSNTIIAAIDVYDLRGKKVLSNQDENTIDISQLNSGIYLMRIQDNLGNFGMKKIIRN
jgi:hypothetical protein